MTALILIAAGLVLITCLCIAILRYVKRFEAHAQEIRRACDILVRLFPLIRDHTPPLPPNRVSVDYQSQVVSPTRRRQEAEEEEGEA